MATTLEYDLTVERLRREREPHNIPRLKGSFSKPIVTGMTAAGVPKKRGRKPGSKNKPKLTKLSST